MYLLKHMEHMEHDGIVFDDFYEEGPEAWSQICESCKGRHFNHDDDSIAVSSIPAEEIMCGVSDCDEEAEFYIDFEAGSYKILQSA